MLYPAELHALKDLAYSTRKGVPVFGLLPSFAPIGYASLEEALPRTPRTYAATTLLSRYHLGLHSQEPFMVHLC